MKNNEGGYSTHDGYGHCRLEPVDIRIVCCRHLPSCILLQYLHAISVRVTN